MLLPMVEGLCVRSKGEDAICGASFRRLCRKSVHGSTGSPQTDPGALDIKYIAVRPELVEGRAADCDTVSLRARNVSAFLMIHGSLFGEFLSPFERGDVTLFLSQPFESLLLSVLTESASLSHSSSIPVLLSQGRLNPSLLR